MKWNCFVVYYGKIPGVYDSWKKCNENNRYKAYNTKKEAEDRYPNFIPKEKMNYEVCKTVWTSGRVKNLIIFIQFIFIMVVFLSCGLVCM